MPLPWDGVLDAFLGYAQFTTNAGQLQVPDRERRAVSDWAVVLVVLINSLIFLLLAIGVQLRTRPFIFDAISLLICTLVAFTLTVNIYASKVF
jgi:hypothetical protein